MKVTDAKKFLLGLGVVFCTLCFASCFNQKNSPFYDSEWVMENVKDGREYIHQIFFKPNKQVTIQAYYLNSPQQIVWTGTYKIDSKKITFNMKNCAQFENGNGISIDKTKIIKYFEGEYFYSVSDENGQYRMELVRPQNFFYGKNLDFMNNPMETWTRVEKETAEEQS